MDDLLRLNKSPLETAQFAGTVVKAAVEQPKSDKTTIDSGEAVDTSTLTACSGVPTRRKKELHGPSLPSLNASSVV